MNEKRLISLVQLANKAGKVASGDQLLDSIRNQKAKVVLYSASTGENRKKKIKDKCASFQVESAQLDPAVFELLTNRPVSSLAVLDAGFAAAILQEVKG